MPIVNFCNCAPKHGELACNYPAAEGVCQTGGPAPLPQPFRACPPPCRPSWWGPRHPPDPHRCTTVRPDSTWSQRTAIGWKSPTSMRTTARKRQRTTRQNRSQSGSQFSWFCKYRLTLNFLKKRLLNKGQRNPKCSKLLVCQKTQETNSKISKLNVPRMLFQCLHWLWGLHLP